MTLQLTERERAALTVEMKRIGSLGGQATARTMTDRQKRDRAMKSVKARAMKLAARASVAPQIQSAQ